jgi:hypothetical protein
MADDATSLSTEGEDWLAWENRKQQRLWKNQNDQRIA